MSNSDSTGPSAKGKAARRETSAEPAQAEKNTTNFFADLEKLRLSPDELAGLGTKEILSHVPVQQPKKTQFFRCHPDPAMTLTAMIVVDNEDDNIAYFVAPPMRDALADVTRPTLLQLAITRKKEPYLSGRSLCRAKTIREAVAGAKATSRRRRSPKRNGSSSSPIGNWAVTGFTLRKASFPSQNGRQSIVSMSFSNSLSRTRSSSAKIIPTFVAIAVSCERFAVSGDLGLRL